MALGSRTGRPRIGMQTLLDRLRLKKAELAAFADELKKIAVDDEEALDAAKRLTTAQRDRGRRYVGTTAIGAAAGPLVSMAGDAMAAAAHPKGQRLKALGDAIRKNHSAPEVVKNVTKGALSGGALQAAREHVQLSDARETYQKYLREHQGA